MSVSRVRTVVYLDVHAGDTPAILGRPGDSHPAAGELVRMVGRDGPGVYEVERVAHDLQGGRHVVRVFVERADPALVREGGACGQWPRPRLDAADPGERPVGRLVA